MATSRFKGYPALLAGLGAGVLLGLSLVAGYLLYDRTAWRQAADEDLGLALIRTAITQDRQGRDVVAGYARRIYLRPGDTAATKSPAFPVLVRPGEPAQVCLKRDLPPTAPHDLREECPPPAGEAAHAVLRWARRELREHREFLRQLNLRRSHT